ncbi:helix-turn-helix domain-containing protein [Pseudomonas sp.]|uniref:helix-turn-helix domain-containing protein n=1 Tax=Pseudomonas sp. TaxID=306 RepID=UPI003BB55392
MSGKKSTPDQSAQAVVLRQAGFTLPAIASRLGISMSTTQRIIKANKVVAGSTKQALIDEAREESPTHCPAGSELRAHYDQQTTRQITSTLETPHV